MSADNSPDFEATWEFLGNRIDNVIHLFQLKESVRLFFTFRIINLF